MTYSNKPFDTLIPLFEYLFFIYQEKVVLTVCVHCHVSICVYVYTCRLVFVSANKAESGI